MSESILKSILEESAMLELKQYDNVPDIKFSFKHSFAMKRIFKLYEKNTVAIHCEAVSKPMKRRLTRKTVLTAAAIVFLAVLTGCTASYFISQDFHGIVHSDNTELFVINADNCPSTIENKYYLPKLPEEFTLLQAESTQWEVYTSYIHLSSGKTITFQQDVKTDCPHIHFNTEKCDFQEVDINGHCGLLLDYSSIGYVDCGVIWDNGDYVLMLWGNLDKKTLLDLAETAKIYEN